MRSFLDALVARFEALEDRLNAFDAATGDGDHGTTILKGLRAAAAAPASPAAAFRAAAGGASGSLFGQLIGALAAVEAGSVPLGQALTTAATKIAQLGQAKEGDKTMLDALTPAARAAEAAPDRAYEAAAAAAAAGAERTTAMIARRGRAKYVEGGGAGHMDAGAMSVAEILTLYAAHKGSRA
jgi:dihydroxyacetone kinase-like protein